MTHRRPNRKPARKPNRKPNRNSDRSTRLPRNAPPVELEITHVGARGDGVGRADYTHNHRTAEHAVFVPATLPGERVVAQPVSLSGQGLKTVLTELLTAAPQRRDPDCDAFPACGGCSFQHWQDESVTGWKQGQLDSFLARAGVVPRTVLPAHVSPRHSRRRAGFHLKRLAEGVAAGFLERGAQRIVAPLGCSVLAPELMACLDRLAVLAETAFPVGIEIEAQANALDNGICLLLGGPEGWHEGRLETLAAWGVEWGVALGAARGVDCGLARLSVREAGGAPLTLLAPAPPVLRFGDVAITPPPGAFLQATREAEAVLQQDVAAFLDGAARITDLYAGCGTLSLPLLAKLSHLTAAEMDPAALAALRAAADMAGRGAQLTCHEADLAAAPLAAAALDATDAVIIDPPRAGAAAQCAALADSQVPLVAMVSCNPATFARDAATLLAGGYQLERLRLVDQFRFSSHIEIFGGFARREAGRISS